MEVDQVAQPEAAKVPFVEKYRPKSLEHIISHTEIVQTSKFLISSDNWLSPEVYRCKEHAALTVPWSARHGQDFVHDRDCQGALRRKGL